MRRSLTLRDAAHSLDAYQLAQIESITITPALGGYAVRMEQWGLFGRADHLGDLPEVSVTELRKRAPFTFDLTWTLPAWDQVLALIHDPTLTQSHALGSMQAAERTFGHVRTAKERNCQWYIVTHGLPGTPERAAWIRSRQITL